MDKDIDWGAFDAGKVNPEILKVIKAASLVEGNATDYAAYLHNVFADDADFRAYAAYWAVEECQHGEALGKWAELADPSWSFKDALARFRAGYQVPIEADASVRGSRSGEMVARCMVETGTSSYYTALGQATQEPVLRQICKKIVADEMRHYKAFYDNLKKYLKLENLSKWGRLKVALGRIAEAEDDELAYAYYAANLPADQPYDRLTCTSNYMRRVLGYYEKAQVERMVAMIFKASGFKPQTRAFTLSYNAAWWVLNRRHRRMEKLGRAA